MKTYKFEIAPADDNIIVEDYFVIKNTDIVIISKQESIVSKLKSEKNIFKVLRTRKIKKHIANICECLTTSSHRDDYFK